MDDFALSTSWNAKAHGDANAIIDEIIEAGFDRVELNFTLTEKIVAGISSMVKKGDIKVVSLHNYCPMPEGVKPNEASPDYYSLASLDEGERNSAIYFTTKTIEMACQLNAKAVVLHCGRIEAKDRTKALMQIFEDGGRDNKDFIRIKDEMLLQRRMKANAHLEKMLMSLDALNKFAEDKKVLLGIENRCYFMEMPSLDEISLIFKNFKGSKICYWHDIGHAQIAEELGFGNHREFLDRYSVYMAGIHFHDTKGIHDHIAPGKGEFDFSVLKPYLKDQLIKVIEAHPPATIDDVRYSKEYLNGVLYGSA